MDRLPQGSVDKKNLNIAVHCLCAIQFRAIDAQLSTHSCTSAAMDSQSCLRRMEACIRLTPE